MKSDEIVLRDLSQEPTGTRGPFGGEIFYNAIQGILYDSKFPYGPTYKLFGTKEPFSVWFNKVKEVYDREKELVAEQERISEADGEEDDD